MSYVVTMRVCVCRHAAVTLEPYAASFAIAVPEGCVLSGLGLDDVHTPRGLSHSMPSDDSQLDALEHTVDVAAVQNSLAHMSMPHGGIKNSRRPQANSPGRLVRHFMSQNSFIDSQNSNGLLDLLSSSSNAFLVLSVHTNNAGSMHCTRMLCSTAGPPFG